MQDFLKLDLRDLEDIRVTVIKAESQPKLLKKELRELYDDDELSPCFTMDSIAECLHADHDSITYSPGDGGSYTIAVYGPRNAETVKNFLDYVDAEDEEIVSAIKNSLDAEVLS